jgi:hypothetical protein
MRRSLLPFVDLEGAEFSGLMFIWSVSWLAVGAATSPGVVSVGGTARGVLAGIARTTSLEPSAIEVMLLGA